MNKYNFETVKSRYKKGSAKWDEMERVNPNVSKNVIPFSVADMEIMTAPEIVNALKEFLDNEILGYASASDSYKEAVCGWLRRRHNWTIEDDWICNTHGVVDAFYTAIKSYTSEGEGVMLMTPVYYPMYRAIDANKRVLVENKLKPVGNTYEIDFEDFEAKAKDENTKLLILCSPHNPCGRVWTKDELIKIGEICLANNVIVVSDEIHFDFVSPGYCHTVFATLSKDFEQNCLVLTAPSKTFNIAGLQTSNIIIPNAMLREKFIAELKTTSVNPKCNILGYEACKAAYNECDEWLEQLKALIEKNRQTIVDFFAKEFPQIKVYDLQGTYLLWMDFGALGIECHELEKILHMEAEVFFDEGYIFGECGEEFERWNLACPNKYIVEALVRIKKALNKHI
ncbi:MULTISPECIES: MalY/PatB family protein [unclassified Sedimentibacter]|uniref:MalY/PatB family protein n=1 Tax=unclassified Sedimentibacter TaxID=2649220 RepID=UPI0027DECC16|nr:MalY/PatB family protein [Sedimentibacter sp. MB35-C1]WMJ77661.1 MalY/PatB family protein [Sedimentibacter sp. MB35-C1]